MQEIQNGSQEGSSRSSACEAEGVRQSTYEIKLYTSYGNPSLGGKALVKRIAGPTPVIILKNIYPSVAQTMWLIMGASIRETFGGLLLDGVSGMWVPIVSSPFLPYVVPAFIDKIAFVSNACLPTCEQEYAEKATEILNSPEWKNA